MINSRIMDVRGYYPFVPDPSEDVPDYLLGIRDLLFTVFGLENPEPSSSSSTPSSSSSGCPSGEYGAWLVRWEASSTLDLRFLLRYESLEWLVEFQLPRTPGLVIERNIPQDGVRAVCTAVPKDFPDSGSGDVCVPVEPANVRFFPESVSSLTIGGVSPPGDLIRWKDGYNTRVSASGGVLTLDAGAGFGIGRFPYEPDEDPSTSSPGPDLTEGVMTVNGVSPRGGNLPLELSRSLIRTTQPGLIVISRRA